MNIQNGEKARVFGIKENGKRKNTMNVSLSTYEGKNKDDEPIYASWLAFFVGNAYEKAKELEEKDKIILTNAKISNFYNKETKNSYYDVTVFDFELDE